MKRTKPRSAESQVQRMAHRWPSLKMRVYRPMMFDAAPSIQWIGPIRGFQREYRILAQWSWLQAVAVPYVFLLDPALKPRVGEDYIDILHLLMGKNHDIPVGAHEVFSAQEIKKAVAASFEGHSKPHEPGLMNVFDKVSGEIGDLDTIAKLGTYLKGIQEADPRFTGRAIKNITDAVKVRAMDFELPDEWMETPDLFLAKDYDTKLNMIKDMRQPITVEMVIQEINRYADSEFRYADKSDEVAIENMVRDFGRNEEAKRRYLKGQM